MKGGRGIGIVSFSSKIKSDMETGEGVKDETIFELVSCDVNEEGLVTSWSGSESSFTWKSKMDFNEASHFASSRRTPCCVPSLTLDPNWPLPTTTFETPENTLEGGILRIPAYLNGTSPPNYEMEREFYTSHTLGKKIQFGNDASIFVYSSIILCNFCSNLALSSLIIVKVVEFYLVEGQI